MHARTIHNVLA